MILKSSMLLAATLLCYHILPAQSSFPYKKAWKKIDSLIQKKSLPQSALEEVNKLYAAAKKEKNEGQWVKAVIYRERLQETTGEDINKSIQELEEEIRSAPPRVNALLKSMEAERLDLYLQRQRYRLSGRTEIQNDSSADISTWTAERLNKEIRLLYLGSLKQENLLQQTALDPFDVAILKGNVRYLRPTLYDLLAYRALGYFQQDGPEQPLAENAFLMDDPAIFLPGAEFTEYGFHSADSTSNHLVALKIFQNLLRFHAPDVKPDAWIDADITRIAFANRYGVMPGKDSLYFSALRHITDTYSSLPVSAQAWYLQAAFFSDRAASFDPLTDTAHQYDYVKAKAICEEVMMQKDSSEGKTNCSSLLQQILRKTCNIQAEKVNVPDLPFRVLVSYKNVPHLYGRIIRIDDATRNNLGNRSWDPKFWKKIGHFPALKSFDQSLPETNDYQLHRVEIKVDALPAGQYALFTSSDPSFSDSSALNLQYFFCSSIAFVNHGPDYFVVDRSSGNPLSGVQVKSFYSVYDYRKQKDIFRKAGSYTTDLHGHFRLNPDKINSYESKLEFYYGHDCLSVSNAGIYSYNNEEDNDTVPDVKAYERKMLKDALFTDRSIYRPGQTVFFKGLLVTRDFYTKRYKAAGEVKTKIYLLDANSRKADSVLVVPDDFGSFHGIFHLPDHLLNGIFRIKDSLTEDSEEFSVEEYKRPRFYVEYDTIQGSYRIGDIIHLTGSAKAYAGNTLNGSRVSYRVFRQSRFPYPWFFRRIPSQAEREITHGETVTDIQGKFKIDFSALADQAVARESKPVFTYRIEAEVTDINGETRSASTTVAASYQSFQIVSALMPESRMFRDSIGKIPVTTQNASGQFQSQLLTVTLYKLKPPGRLIRKRYWEEPDQFVMGEEEYIKTFPYDEYRNETNKANWERIEVVEKKTDSTTADGLFDLDDKKTGQLFPGPHTNHYPSAGWYLIEFTAKDRNGEEITDKRYVELMDSGGTKLDYPNYNVIVSEDVTSEPGNVVTIRTGTAAEDVFVIRANKRPGDSLSAYSFYQLSNKVQWTELKIDERDRGGFAVNDVFVKNNRWYSSTHTIHVPWSNKELQISYETWRNRMLPGSSEKWKIRISGYKKNKVAAEVLTSMYDASLDQFKKHSWNIPDLYPEYSGGEDWNGISSFNDQSSTARSAPGYPEENFYKQYDRLIYSGSGDIQDMLSGSISGVVVTAYGLTNKKSESVRFKNKEVETMKFASPKIARDEEVRPDKKTQDAQYSDVQIRKNFNETAFFFPDLKTDADGNVEVSFTMPEALTRWKWMIFAHTRDLAFGYSGKTVVTQKELMLQPNMPRFFREGDSMSLPVKISNLSSGIMTGSVSLNWLDAWDSSNLDNSFQNKTASQPFRVEAGQSTVVYFSTVIPGGFREPVVYRLQAQTNTGAASDGEEGLIPVLSNRMLVTETLPLNMTGRNNKHFSWEKLLNSKTSPTLQNQSLTVEYTSNPAWYAVQSLPYLMEFPYECAEQTFNRFYANALATQIISSAPGIQEIFEKWKSTDSSALLSNLQKNEELKTVLLRETPWVLDAQNENQQKKNLALLFDMVRMSRELKSTLDKLKQAQSESGGFPWFKGGRDDRYITQYIISGIGHLKKLKAIPANEEPALNQILRAGINYLDKELKAEYDHRPKKEEEDLSPTQIQYLYMRSFFPEVGLPGSVFPAMNYYRKQAIQYWPKQNMYLRGMIALFLYRTGDRKTAKDILASLKENATQSEDLGMYWKSLHPGYYWQESPVEAQSLLIEAFDEINPDLRLINRMKYWLLQQKQVQHWSNTKATADACYALLLNGSNWLASMQTTRIKLGDYIVSTADEKTEKGTGYMKKVIPGTTVQPAMGNIQVTVQQDSGTTVSPSWGALYWQYFENLNRITVAQSPLSISKVLYTEKNTNTGRVMEALSEGNMLKPGDKLIVRIIIKCDRDMEYVHLKDMRAACLEPVNVLSGYHWQGSVGYYESTKDESSSFFFDYLPKGTHVFEYPLFVTMAGAYSNGISTVECMYAPEFAAHTAGERIQAEAK